ncbi:MAG: DUF362 domain-containing protein [bacterium]
MNLVYAKKIREYDIQRISDFFNQVFSRENVYAEALKKNLVLLKPNLLSKPTREIDFVTTNRVVVESVAKLLMDNGISSAKIVLGDGASAINKNMDAIFEESGMTSISKRYSISLVNFNGMAYIERKGMKIADFLDNDPYIINLAKLKTHMLTMLTLSVKNLYGLLPSEIKISYHSQFNTDDSFCNLLSKLYSAVSPHFNIIDGIVGMEGNGPGGGDRKEINILACSKNGFALDDFIGDVCGFKKDELLFIKHGVKNNLYDGTYTVEGEYDKVILKRPTRNAFTLPLSIANARFARFFLSSYPKIINESCMRCFKCAKMCPEKAITIKDGFPFVRERKCVACYCCVEVCPYKSIKTKKSVFEKTRNV